MDRDGGANAEPYCTFVLCTCAVYYTVHDPCRSPRRAGGVPDAAADPVPSLIEPLPRLTAALGGGPRLLIKRDDAIAFGFGGNKVRKLAFVAAHAQSQGADTLITAGGVQSNHARATAAVAAKLGMRAVLVANGAPPPHPPRTRCSTRCSAQRSCTSRSRDERKPKMERDCRRLMRSAAGHPYVIPIGASMPLGALGFVHAVAELVEQIDPPDFIVHSTSSGGTQAGLDRRLPSARLPTRVIGISADDSSESLSGCRLPRHRPSC